MNLESLLKLLDSNWAKAIAAALLAIILFYSCQKTVDNNKRTSTHERFQLLVQKWESELGIAQSTPRMSLPDVLISLSETQREIEAFRGHSCIDPSLSQLKESAGATMQAMNAFLGSSSIGYSYSGANYSYLPRLLDGAKKLKLAKLNVSACAN